MSNERSSVDENQAGFDDIKPKAKCLQRFQYG